MELGRVGWPEMTECSGTMSSVRPPKPVSANSRPVTPRRNRVSTLLMAVLLIGAAPLMAGCLERSTTVGDRFSGTVIVATTPDNPQGRPTFDIPASMASSVSVTDYREGPQPEGGGTQPSTPEGVEDKDATRIGSRVTFNNLTAGQFSQFGDIVASAFGDSAMTMDLSAKRSGEVVRFRGSADLTGLVANRDYLKLTVSFAGPVTATNGDQISDTSVTWTPEPAKPSDFTADATYPDPATAAFGSWSWVLAIICAVVVLLVIRLAYLARDRGDRPGRPKSSGPKSTRPDSGGRKLFGRNAAPIPASTKPVTGDSAKTTETATRGVNS